MKPAKNKFRKLALHPDTVAILTPRQLTEVRGGFEDDGSSGSCETRPPRRDQGEN